VIKTETIFLSSMANCLSVCNDWNIYSLPRRHRLHPYLPLLSLYNSSLNSTSLSVALLLCLTDINVVQVRQILVTESLALFVGRLFIEYLCGVCTQNVLKYRFNSFINTLIK